MQKNKLDHLTNLKCSATVSFIAQRQLVLYKYKCSMTLKVKIATQISFFSYFEILLETHKKHDRCENKKNEKASKDFRLFSLIPKFENLHNMAIFF